MKEMAIGKKHMKMTIRILGAMPKPSQMANSGPSTITGTVWVTTRCGKMQRLKVRDRSIRIARMMASRADSPSPISASLSVTDAWYISS